MADRPGQGADLSAIVHPAQGVLRGRGIPPVLAQGVCLVAAEQIAEEFLEELHDRGEEVGDGVKDAFEEIHCSTFLSLGEEPVDPRPSA